MTERYFCELPFEADNIVLRGPEAHHLLNVMRAKTGDAVVLFDGNGQECVASVVSTDKREVELHIRQRQMIDREPGRKLTLGVALPKGDRQKWLVEKAVELGVATLVPLMTERSVAKPKPGGIERLQRYVIEASKQCGRNRLMAIESPRAFGEIVGHPPDDGIGLIAHADAQGLSNGEIDSSSPVTALIGPEGGFSEHEIEQAMDASWRCVSLGKRILRVETAALKIAASLLGD